MEKQRDKLSIIILMFFILFFILGIRKSWMQQTEDQALKSSFKITNGSFVDCGVGKTSDFGSYTFILNDRVYTNYFKTDKFCFQLTIPFCTELKKYKFPIAYSPENPELNQMLLSKRDFGKYNVIRSDSLSLVFDRYFDCR